MKRIITIVVIISAIISSCIKEYETYVYFYVKNASSYDVTLYVSNAYLGKGFPIDTTIVIPKDGQFNYTWFVKGKNDEKYIFPFGDVSDTACISFDNNFKFIYIRGDANPRNILHRESYVGGKVKEKNGQISYEYTYTITDNDYYKP